MNISYRLPWAAAVFVCACTGAQAQSISSTVTIEQAVAEALNHNLSLLSDRFAVSVADAAVMTASLRPNPVMTAGALVPDSALYAAGTTPRDEVVRTDYVIERGAKRDRRIEQATLGRSVAELQLLNATRLLVLDVESAFIDVQLAKLNLTLAQQNLDAFQNLVAISGERVRTGDLSAVELSRSQLAALQFQNDVAQQQAKLTVARNRLSLLIGRGPDGGALDVGGDLRADRDARQLAALQQLALERRPDVAAARAEQARSVADLRLQLANGAIDLTVSGEFHRQQAPTVGGHAGAVYVSLPLPIFNRNQGEIARARVEQQQLATRLQAAEAEVKTEVGNAFTQYTTALTIVDRVEHDMLTRAEQVRSATEYSYRRGEASFVEFLDAVRAFNDTMQGYNEARAEYARSLYTLDAISGQVTP